MIREHRFAVVVVVVLLAVAVFGGVRWWRSDGQVERRFAGEVADLPGVRDVDTDEKRVVLSDEITVERTTKVLERLATAEDPRDWTVQAGVAELGASDVDFAAGDVAAGLVMFGTVRDPEVERILLADRGMSPRAQLTVAEPGARLEVARKVVSAVAAGEDGRSWDVVVGDGMGATGGQASVEMRKVASEGARGLAGRLGRLAGVVRTPADLVVDTTGVISELRVSVTDEQAARATWEAVEGVLEKDEKAQIVVGESEKVTYEGAAGERIEPALAATRVLLDAGASAVTWVDLGLTEIAAEAERLSAVAALGKATADLGPKLKLSVTWPEPVSWRGDGSGPAQIVDSPAEVARVAPKLAKVAKLGYVILWGQQLTVLEKEGPYVLAYPKPEGDFREDELGKVMTLLRDVGWSGERLVGAVGAAYDCGHEGESGTVVAWIRSTAKGRGTVATTDYSRAGTVCEEQIDAMRPLAAGTVATAWTAAR